MPAPRKHSGNRGAEVQLPATNDGNFMHQCRSKVARIQELLQAHPDAANALKRKTEEEKLDLRLLTQVEKEKKELEQASKRLRQVETRAKEEVQNAAQVTQTLQAHAVWQDFWACSRIEELRQYAYAEKMRADELARRVAIYELRFGYIHH